jgi:hypothetical protein
MHGPPLAIAAVAQQIQDKHRFEKNGGRGTTTAHGAQIHVRNYCEAYPKFNLPNHQVAGLYL